MKYIANYTIIFNNLINNTHYPNAWKLAKIIPIYKKGKNLEEAASYRPICLLPNISKVFEALLNTRITKHCDDHKIIPDDQFGFRHQHSTCHAIHRVIKLTIEHLNQHEMVAACLLDMEKAFDSVWIKGLIYKLKKKKFS